MKNKVVIFDFDGVIVDSGAAGLKYLALRFPGFTKEHILEILKGNFHENLDKYKRENGYDNENSKHLEEISKNHTREKLESAAFPGIIELLQQLHNSGYTLALNTSASNKNLVPLLIKLGIHKYFDEIASKELSVSKVEKFKIISEKYNTAPLEMLFVTDTLGDLNDAQQCNVPTIAVTWGAHDRKYFNHQEYSCLIKIVDTATELSEAVENFFKK